MDIKELLKQEIEPNELAIHYLDGKASKDEVRQILGINQLKKLQLLLNPSSLYIYYNVVLDTNKVIFSSDGKQFSWNCTYTKNVLDTFCNLSGDVRNIIGIRMFQPRIHYISGDLYQDRMQYNLVSDDTRVFVGINWIKLNLDGGMQLVANESIFRTDGGYGGNSVFYRFYEPTKTYQLLVYSPDEMFVNYYFYLTSLTDINLLINNTNLGEFNGSNGELQYKANTLGTTFIGTDGLLYSEIIINGENFILYSSSDGMSGNTKRIAILIREFQGDSFTTSNGKKFHFIFRPQYLNQSGKYIELSIEDYNDGIYNFNRPINTFDRLTLEFSTPFDTYIFPQNFNRMIFHMEFTCIRTDTTAT